MGSELMFKVNKIMFAWVVYIIGGLYGDNIVYMTRILILSFMLRF